MIEIFRATKFLDLTRFYKEKRGSFGDYFFNLCSKTLILFSLAFKAFERQELMPVMTFGSFINNLDFK